MSRAKGSHKETAVRRRKEKAVPPETDEEIMQRIDDVMKDEAKYNEWLTSRVETVLKNWPKR